MPIALTIAGFDPSSGAGVTADLAVFAAHGLFGTSAITTLTVQSTLGVAATLEPSATHLRHTLDHLWDDLHAAGIKIGALGSAENAATIASFLDQTEPDTGLPAIPVVFDPVMLSSSGRALFPPDQVDTLHETILPLVSWITPNWPELTLLSGRAVSNLEEATSAAHLLGKRHPRLSIVATGGDQSVPVDMLRTPDGSIQTFHGEHIDSTSTHGTGCAFSSALLAALILGRHSPASAVSAAKAYVSEAIRRAIPLGHGRGPLNLLWPLH